MAWPDHIIEKFDIVDVNTTDESEYFAPYNALLNFLFPSEQHFAIAPQYKGPVFPGSIDFTTIYIVQRQKHPVFFIDIKPQTHLKHDRTRAAADKQMRERYTRLKDDLAIDKLYGLSAMGAHFAVYEYDRATNRLRPAQIPADPEVMLDVAPKERWQFDLLSEVGSAKLAGLVDEVKEMCNAL